MSINLTKSLIILNVVIFILTIFNKDLIFATFAASRYHGLDYTLITHQFLHGGVMHILFNMIALYQIVGFIEDRLYPTKTLIYYLVLGSLSVIPTILTSNNFIVGASGSISGMAGMYFFMTRNRQHKIMILLYAVVDFLMIGSNDGIAHTSHLAGFILGLLAFKFTLKKSYLY